MLCYLNPSNGGHADEGHPGAGPVPAGGCASRAAARDAAGWHVCLEFLASHLDGTPEPPASMWTKVHPGYVSSFGPEASAIGVPSGYEPADS